MQISASSISPARRVYDHSLGSAYNANQFSF